MTKISITIESKDVRERLSKYLNTIYKFHKLTDKEIEIVVEFIHSYYIISDSFKDENAPLINKLLFETDNRKELQNILNIKEDIFNNYISKLRKKKVFIGETLNKLFIPPKGLFTLEIKFT